MGFRSHHSAQTRHSLDCSGAAESWLAKTAPAVGFVGALRPGPLGLLGLWGRSSDYEFTQLGAPFCSFQHIVGTLPDRNSKFLRNERPNGAGQPFDDPIEAGSRKRREVSGAAERSESEDGRPPAKQAKAVTPEPRGEGGLLPVATR